jgi:tetratricopeptide (TPR) repeat protein
MHRALAVLALASLLALFLVAPAAGDTIYLKNGGKFEGKLIKETASEVIFKTKLGTQTFKKKDVLRIEKGETAFDQYEKKRKALKPEDADGIYELGLWCEEVKLRKEARQCYRAAVKADPDHARAREKLGYVSHEGSWVTKKKYAEIMEEIRKKEQGILDGLKLEKLYTDAEARFKIGTPKDWEKEVVEGGSIAFAGPTLGKAPFTVKMEAESAGDTLAAFTESVEKDLKRKHEGLERIAEPADAKLAGRPAKLLLLTHSRDDLAVEAIPIEIRCLTVIDPAGDFALTFSYRKGYYELLKPFLDLIERSVRIMPKPLDVQASAWGYGYVLVDGYEKAEGFPLPVQIQGGPQIEVPPGTGSASRSAAGVTVFFSVIPGKKNDGKVDATSLETLRDSIPKVLPLGSAFQRDGEEQSTTIDGQSALRGKYKFQMGDLSLANGYWAVVMKGDNYYICAFVNFLGRMGMNYVKEDFEKFLSGFRFLKEG